MTDFKDKQNWRNYPDYPDHQQCNHEYQHQHQQYNQHLQHQHNFTCNLLPHSSCMWHRWYWSAKKKIKIKIVIVIVIIIDIGNANENATMHCNAVTSTKHDVGGGVITAPWTTPFVIAKHVILHPGNSDATLLASLMYRLSPPSFVCLTFSVMYYPHDHPFHCHQYIRFQLFKIMPPGSFKRTMRLAL